MVDPFKTKSLSRLKKVRGQIDGIIKMIEEGKYCIDVVTQILALDGALRGVVLLALESHLNTCGTKLNSKDQQQKQQFIKELIKVCELSSR